MPPAKKTTPRKTAGQPAPPVPPTPAAGGSSTMIGILCGREVEVRPVSEWRKSAMNALQSADLETWADRCLTDEGYDVWEQLDPTFGEIAEFFASFSDEMAAATDVQFPGGPKPSRSQRRTAGRR